MSAADDSEFRALTPSDADAMRSFSCRDFKAPWTEVVQEMIRGSLAQLVENGTEGVYGLWLDGVLVAVGAWTIDASVPPVCRSAIIAVSNVGHRRKGFGRRLKGEEITLARAAGAGSVVSQVHWNNDAMIDLNVELDANVEEIPGDREYCRCVIPL